MAEIGCSAAMDFDHPTSKDDRNLLVSFEETKRVCLKTSELRCEREEFGQRSYVRLMTATDVSLCFLALRHIYIKPGATFFLRLVD